MGGTEEAVEGFINDLGFSNSREMINLVFLIFQQEM